MEIKKATMKDLKNIQKLNQMLCTKEKKDYDPTIMPEWSLMRGGENYFKKKISNKDSCAFVAVENDKVIGYLVGGIAEKEEYRLIKNLAELEGLFVLKEFRGLGIGTKLFRAFNKWCKDKSKRIKVIVSAQNERAIKFYKEKGFKDYTVILEMDWRQD